MPTLKFSVRCEWDEEARVWYVAESSVPGLATEAETLEQMEQKLKTMIPELVLLNRPSFRQNHIPWELIAHKSQDLTLNG